MSNIHKTAIIEDGAILGENVTVGAYTIIGKDVKIGDGTVIDSHTVIAGKTKWMYKCTDMKEVRTI